MKNVVIVLLVLAAASWANALTDFTASWEDGEVNPGGNDQITSLNTTPYPATQPEVISNGEYGWFSGTAYQTPAESTSTIVDTESYYGGNSVKLINRVLRTDIPFTIQANTIYTFTVWHKGIDGASTLGSPDGFYGIKFVLKDQGHNTNLILQEPDYAMTSGWTKWTATWDSAGYAYAGQSVQLRLAVFAGKAIGDGAYIDSMSLTAIPEPATLAILGLGGLLLRRRK
jgi:hypothetical protein